ncbi:Tektin-2 like protein [Argiope bruennichi]|uniref:Tektin n=1 Tax=Argiope bruennichi TaxID=94029 RepID=A0A8T0EW02_ARGBR|nr:Tektin-2 like protein [Argiope bruennichi]
MYNSYQEKSLPHFTPGDWHSYGKNLDSITNKITYTGNNVRQEAAQLRNSVTNTMSWKLKDTNQKLADRINEVDQWFRNLDRTLREVTDAIDKLSEAKQEVERTLAANIPLHEASKEVLNLRDRRRDIDLVEDEVYHEVKKEVDLIHEINESLREASRHNWDHLVELKEQRDQLEADLKDKELALKIDRFQLSLNPTTTNIISLKPWPADACSAGECPVSLETWLQNCLDKRTAAEDAIAKATRATNDSWNMMRKSNNDIHHQRDATQFALRKRRHETLQQRDALAAQRKDLKDEIERLEREMLNIEQEADISRGNLKLVQTRMESRKSRPRMELVRDHPTFGLEEELRHVVESREYLAQKLRDVKNVLNRTQQHLHEVEDDLQRKERSLAIETTCIELHERPSKSPYQTDIAWLAPMNTTSTSHYTNQSIDRGTNQRIVDRHMLEHRPRAALVDPEYHLID